MPPMKQIGRKIILLGGFAVGKTSLTNQFAHKKFSNQYVSTVGVNIEKKMILLDEVSTEVNLMVWDLADITMETDVPESYFSGAHGVIWIFDLSRPATWIGLKEQVAEVMSKIPGVPLVLVGNKVDLVEADQVQERLDQAGLTPEFMTSAKTGVNVDLLFKEMARLIVQ
jgi:small GTP-binding protein